jgi:NADH-quinone oxidoreductase subunit M
VIAIIYTSLVALAQQDMKKMIAYSSVAHMGYVTLGIFTATTQGVEGGVFQMISHGIISAALFLCVGVVYDRLHTREISRYGGLVQNMPKYATVFMIFMLGSVGLPGTSGFVGEILSLVGAYQVSTLIAVLATLGVVLGAAYMLLLYRKVVFGPQDNDDAAAMKDLTSIEKITLVPLAILTIWLGVQPGIVMDRISPSVDHLLERVHHAADTQQGELSGSDRNDVSMPAAVQE